ncbi:hypothetical protein THAOC_30560 [Thalassiosira oceanica]|uniref:Uncharacterized protein n=1 Tax=Thalassiosira oceanica TaxID=159749 RepID=K0RNG9_THAOC|nr:hypothetical protein THAOC_30560 [Thalassiosira oceanica]|eukprot:EJK50466.1 hypothetical protein THAOC_30560 [Thalassiosira oceanica]
MGSSQSRNGILEEPFHLLRRDGRTQTQASTLVTNPVGRARMGSEEGRWTDGWLYRVLREGHFRHGRARLVSRWTGKARFGAPALERHRCRRGGTYRRDRTTQERIGVQPGVSGGGGGRIRQYTAAGGAPVVYSGLRHGRVQWISAEDAYYTTRTARMTRESGGGRRRHDSSNDGSSKGELDGGAARRKHARWLRDSSPEDGGGAGRPLRGRGDRNGRQDYSEEEHGRSRTPVVGLGGESGEGTRSRRGGWDSGDDMRAPERRRHDSSDEDDDGSDSVDAATSSGHGSGLENAGNFAVAERKPRKRQHRELEKYNAMNGGDRRTVYRDKSGRRREVDPAAEETELPGLRGRRRRGRYGRTGVRGRGTSRHSSSRPLPPRQSRGGINDQYLEAPKKAEICPMAAHAWRRQEEESAGTDGAPCWKHARRGDEATAKRVNGGRPLRYFRESAEECPLFIGKHTF